MTSPANVGSFVVPGTTVDVNDDDTLGRGVIQASNGPVATVVGTLSRADGVPVSYTHLTLPTIYSV